MIMSPFRIFELKLSSLIDSDAVKGNCVQPVSFFWGGGGGKLDVRVFGRTLRIVWRISSRQKKDLEALETLTRVSQKVRSQLDPGYLDPIGEGSFGHVFRAKKDGREVAVKILKNVENRKQIEDFEREVDTLRLNNKLCVIIHMKAVVCNNSARKNYYLYGRNE